MFAKKKKKKKKLNKINNSGKLLGQLNFVPIKKHGGIKEATMEFMDIQNEYLNEQWLFIWPRTLWKQNECLKKYLNY